MAAPRCSTSGLLCCARHFAHRAFWAVAPGSMAGVGIAWASTLSMPYSILAGSLPYGKTGVCMGIFNFFIVIPEITASLGFGWVMGLC